MYLHCTHVYTRRTRSQTRVMSQTRRLRGDIRGVYTTALRRRRRRRRPEPVGASKSNLRPGARDGGRGTARWKGGGEPHARAGIVQ